jgi:tRNA(fMet)-specific endonuclease VapC
MSRFLLDTDTLTLVQFDHPKVIQRLAAHPDIDIAVAILSVQEQMRGWLGRLNRLTMPDKLADWYEELTNRLFPVWRRYTLLSFTEPAILRFEQLRALRLNVGLMDLRIASVALQKGLIVVTRNRRDFGRIPGVTTEDWSI